MGGGGGQRKKTRSRFNQIFNFNDWLRPRMADSKRPETISLFFRHAKCCFLPPDRSSKLDLNGGRWLLYVSLCFTCCSMDSFARKMFVFFSLATKMNFRVFLWYDFFARCYCCCSVSSVCTGCERLINMIIVYEWGRKKGNNSTHCPKNYGSCTHAYAHIHILSNLLNE